MRGLPQGKIQLQKENMEYRHAVLEIVKNRPSEGYRGNEKEVYVLREKSENRRLVSERDLIENVSVHSMNCIYNTVNKGIHITIHEEEQVSSICSAHNSALTGYRPSSQCHVKQYGGTTYEFKAGYVTIGQGSRAKTKEADLFSQIKKKSITECCY